MDIDIAKGEFGGHCEPCAPNVSYNEAPRINVRWGCVGCSAAFISRNTVMLSLSSRTASHQIIDEVGGVKGRDDVGLVAGSDAEAETAASAVSTPITSQRCHRSRFIPGDYLTSPHPLLVSCCKPNVRKILTPTSVTSSHSRYPDLRSQIPDLEIR